MFHGRPAFTIVCTRGRYQTIPQMRRSRNFHLVDLPYSGSRMYIVHPPKWQYLQRLHPEDLMYLREEVQAAQMSDAHPINHDALADTESRIDRVLSQQYGMDDEMDDGDYYRIFDHGGGGIPDGWSGYFPNPRFGPADASEANFGYNPAPGFPGHAFPDAPPSFPARHDRSHRHGGMGFGRGGEAGSRHRPRSSTSHTNTPPSSFGSTSPLPSAVHEDLIDDDSDDFAPPRSHPRHHHHSHHTPPPASSPFSPAPPFTTTTDLYARLSLPRTCTPQDLLAAKRALAKKFHPDRVASGTEEQKEEAGRRMAEVNEAFDVLSDEGRRRVYDMTGEFGEGAERMAGAGMAAGGGGVSGFEGMRGRRMGGFGAESERSGFGGMSGFGRGMSGRGW